jgi:hypothetical protein
MKILCISFGHAVFCTYAPGYIQTFISLTLFDLSNRKPSKNLTLRNIQEVQASKLGDAPEAPLLHRQKSGHLSTYYIFIASCIMRFSWSVSCFQFLVLFSFV